MALDLSQLGEWQHCQRNWDLSREVSEEHIDNLLAIATQMPIKQNNDYFDLAVVTDRSVIERMVHLTPRGAYDPDNERESRMLARLYPDPSTYPKGIETFEQLLETWQWNPQVLAPVLMVFVRKPLNIDDIDDRSGYATLWGQNSQTFQSQIEQDMFTAIGLAAGAMIAYARDKGMATAMCTCHNHQAIGKLLGYDEGYRSQLIFCVGYPNPNLPYKQHHVIDKLDLGHLDRPNIKVKRI